MFNTFILYSNIYIQVYIYDPDFGLTLPCELTQEEKDTIAAGKQKTKNWCLRLSELQEETRIRNIFKHIKGKFTVEEIWIGGRGNSDLKCLQMCADQLELIENSNEDVLNLAWAEEQLREQLYNQLYEYSILKIAEYSVQRIQRN